jgi:hypothetical protein
LARSGPSQRRRRRRSELSTRILIDEVDKTIWVQLNDDPYKILEGGENNVIYSTVTGKLVGHKMPLYDPELEVYRIKDERTSTDRSGNQGLQGDGI